MITTLICIFLSFNPPSNNIDTTFIKVEKIKANEIAAVENQFNSTKKELDVTITSTKNLFPGAEKYTFGSPLVYSRKQKDFKLDVQVVYFYSLPDSLVRLIVYDWDFRRVANTGTQEEVYSAKSDLVYTRYTAKYERLKEELVEKLGKPDKKLSHKPSKEQSKGMEYWFRDDTWVNKSNTIDLAMTFTTDATYIGIYRIKARVYWDE